MYNAGPPFIPSGPTAASGFVPQPPASAGSSLYMCEDGLWKDPTSRLDPGGRLGTEDGNIYVNTSAASSALYYNPFRHHLLPVYDADRSLWTVHDITAGLGISLSTSANTNYDVYAFTDSVRSISSINATTNVITLDAASMWNTGAKVVFSTTGGGITAGQPYYWRKITTTTGTLHANPFNAHANSTIIDLTGANTSTIVALSMELYGWTSDTTPVVGRTMFEGRRVMTGTTSRHWLGTVRGSAANQVDDEPSKRFVWNCYNRVQRSLVWASSGSTQWTYAVSAYRQANADAAAKVEFVCGFNTADMIEITVASRLWFSISGSAGHVGVGLDSTTVNSAQVWNEAFQNDAIARGWPVSAHYKGEMTYGYHAMNWLEYRRAGTCNFSGTNAGGTQSGITGSVFC